MCAVRSLSLCQPLVSDPPQLSSQPPESLPTDGTLSEPSLPGSIALSIASLHVIPPITIVDATAPVNVPLIAGASGGALACVLLVLVGIAFWRRGRDQRAESSVAESNYGIVPLGATQPRQYDDVEQVRAGEYELASSVLQS